jgi:hypothetical protein
MNIEETEQHEGRETRNENRDYGGHEEDNNYREEGMEGSDGLHLSKRTLWMMAGGAAGALAVLGFGKAFSAARPAAVSAVKEAYGFKEWLAARLETAREDIEDVVAEAVFGYQKDLAATADVVKREKEILEKVEKAVDERLAKARTEKKEQES